MRSITETGGGPAPLALRMLTAWAGPRAAIRGLSEECPSEGRLLFFAMLSGFIYFLGACAELWLDPATAAIPEDELVARVAALLVGALTFRTLALYGFAALAGLVARRCGGTGDWRETRLAVFWSALVAAPVGFAATVVAGLLPDLRDLARFAAEILASLAFAVAFSTSLAEVHGFRHPWKVFLGVALSAVGVAAVAGLLGGS